MGCSIVHFVGDRYDIPDEASLKCDERLRRDQSKFSPEYIPVDNIEIPDWDALLKNPLNKGHILHYLSSSWCQNYRLLPGGVHLFLWGTFNDKSRTTMVTGTQCSEIDQLSCSSHEEADTRMIAHIHFTIAAFGCQRVVVHATDTDVIMLCLYHFCRLPLTEMWIEKNAKFLSIHTLIRSFCEHTQRSDLATSDCLLLCYVLTGCDTVSYPYRRGKRTAAHCALKRVGCFPHVSEFGKENSGMDIRKVHIDEARDFFVALYGREGFKSLDVLRAHFWSSGKGDLRSLPPTEDAFRLHVARALYQLSLYKRAHLADPLLPVPTQFGRKQLDGKLLPIMMEKASKPPSTKKVYCKCKKSKCLKACPCSKASVPCVLGCFCIGAQGKCGRVEVRIEESSDDEGLY